MSGSAAAAGAILSRKFGHGTKTDGFFDAYGVYLALVLVASALRVVVLPRLARAHAEARLGRETVAWALALAIPIAPVLVVAVAAPHTVAGLLTSNSHARADAAELLPWLIPAAAAQVLAGLAASALAALDDYGTAALGFSAGAVLSLATILAFVDQHGVVAFGWGLAVNGAVAAGLPLAVLVSRGVLSLPDPAVWRRLRLLVEGVALPFALQGLYLVCLRFASGLGSGNQTTFSYAYLIASVLVAVTATSMALISSVPLARGELTPELAARHIVAASWLSLALVAAAAGFFALAGARIGRLVLGSSYGGTTGTELGRLVAYLAPWMVVSIALSVAFPLLFVLGRSRWLPALAVAALLVQVLAAWAGRAAFGLAGLAAGLAVTTAAVLLVLLGALDALRATARGVLVAAGTCGLGALVLFGAPRLAVGALPAAFVGLALYAAVLTVWRPPGLVAAWGYMRRLH